MSVARAQQEISSSEFNYWVAYHRINPLGPERTEFMIAQLCAMFAQAHAAKGKKYSPFDFMPWTKREKKKQTPEEMKKVLMAFASAHNGVKIKGK